jgi:hypothetical protein
MLDADAEGAVSGGCGERLFVGGGNEVNGVALQACYTAGAVFCYEECGEAQVPDVEIYRGGDIGDGDDGRDAEDLERIAHRGVVSYSTGGLAL